MNAERRLQTTIEWLAKANADGISLKERREHFSRRRARPLLPIFDRELGE